MKIMRLLPTVLGVLFLATPAMFAQDLSKYRDFSLGMRLAEVAKRTDKTPGDAIVVEQKPALIQELTSWPVESYQPSARVDSAEEMVFSFYNDALYKIAISYSTASTQGLTAADVTESLSAKYGSAIPPPTKARSADNSSYSNTPETIASWEDAQYYLLLVRSPLSKDFRLVMSSKQMNGQAEAAIAAATARALEDAPQIAIAHAKQEADDLEITRQANLKAFRP